MLAEKSTEATHGQTQRHNALCKYFTIVKIITDNTIVTNVQKNKHGLTAHSAQT